MKLPLFENRNIRLFYAMTALNEMWFIAGNWIFFWTRFMTYGQLGIVDAIAFAFGLLMEIPTGGVADILGKRKTIITAFLLSTIGVFMISPATSLPPIVIGFLILQLGWALYSGSAEALAYDTLVDYKQEKHFDEVISTSQFIAIFASVFGSLAGGLLFIYNFRLPHFAWGFAMLIGFFLAFMLKEPKADTETFSWKGYFTQLKEGAEHLFNKSLIKYIFIFFALQGAYFIYSFGFIKPAVAISFGFLDKSQAIIFAILSVLSAVIVKVLPKIRSMVSDYVGISVLTAIIALGFLLAAFPIGYYGLVVMFMIALAGKLSTPWVSVVVNKRIESKYRATTISTLAMFARLPYVLVAIKAGQMIESGNLSTFNMSLAAVLFSVLFLTIIANRIMPVK